MNVYLKGNNSEEAADKVFSEQLTAGIAVYSYNFSISSGMTLIKLDI